MSLIPDMPPRILTLSAVAVGYLLIDDLSANDQNALGNWLMLIAQTLCTNAYFRQIQDQRHNQHNYTEQEIIVMLKKMVDALNKEICEIKKQL